MFTNLLPTGSFANDVTVTLLAILVKMTPPPAYTQMQPHTVRLRALELKNSVPPGPEVRFVGIANSETGATSSKKQDFIDRESLTSGPSIPILCLLHPLGPSPQRL